jgi:hypothetical protein
MRVVDRPMASPVARLFAYVLLGLPARRAGAAALADGLASSASPLEAHFRAAAADPRAGRQLRHVIAIERWGQPRLRAALGDARFVADESGAYRPPDDVPYERLLDELRDTRAVTVELARRVVAEGRAEAVVEHNSLGALRAGGWLRYLRVHADLEARRVRAR